MSWVDDEQMLATARRHAAGDLAVGRGWSCYCAACRMARHILALRAVARATQ